MGVPLQVTRYSAGSWVQGSFVVGGSSTLIVRTFQWGPQPASGREVEQLPEAERGKATMKFYTREEIYPTRTSQDAQLSADEVSWDGRVFRVVSVGSYTGPFSASKVMMVEVDE